MKILVIQTAFIGDVVLTLPLVSEARRLFGSCSIDMVVIPAASNLTENHPDISETIVFDKRGNDSGFAGLTRKASLLKERKYDIALVPHRSLRSALLVRMANIPQRLGYTTSTGRRLFTKLIHYNSNLHEIERNLKFLEPYGYNATEKVLPRLYPSESDKKIVDDFFSVNAIPSEKKVISIAPGAVWNTKRWGEESFVSLTKKIAAEGFTTILIGGSADSGLCEEIKQLINSDTVINSAGKFSLVQSAEIIRRSALIVSNDSAPMHLAVAMETPVIAIFGATVPQFGFYPYGKRDSVVEMLNLPCRPCGIHGGVTCPITTFDCMAGITAEMVYERITTLV